MKTRRNCVEVIDQMLAVIPYTEEGLIKALIENRRDAMFKSPEETIQWERTGETLDYWLQEELSEQWKKDVYKIFTTKEWKP